MLKNPNLESAIIVSKFPEVFPDDLPDIPPKTEIEFVIDLVPEM